MAARIPRPASGWAAPRNPSSYTAWRLLAISGLVSVLIGAGLVAYAVTRSGGAAGEGGVTSREYVVYAQFGLSADVLFEAPAGDPSAHKKLFEIPHAREFGILPSIAPNGRFFAYTILPPGTAAPAPDKPAELWLASLDGREKPRILGGGFDLLVRPLWWPNGTRVITRRSSGVSYELVAVEVGVGAAQAQPESLVISRAALFPVAFTPDGEALYYAALHPGGSDLHRLDLASGASTLVAHLSDELTRDWTLSPSGGRLAYLGLGEAGAGTPNFRVHVLELETGQHTSPGESGEGFGPAWSPSGELTYGRLSISREATGVVVGGGAIAAPPRGFESPLAWSRSGSAIAVRSFDGSSLSAPGRTALTLLTPAGSRKTIAYGEATFLGWTYR